MRAMRPGTGCSRPSTRTCTDMPAASAATSCVPTLPANSSCRRSTRVSAGCSSVTFSPGTTWRLATMPAIGAISVPSRKPTRVVSSEAWAALSAARAVSSCAREFSSAMGDMNDCDADRSLDAWVRSAWTSVARADSRLACRSATRLPSSASSMRPNLPGGHPMALGNLQRQQRPGGLGTHHGGLGCHQQPRELDLTRHGGQPWLHHLGRLEFEHGCRRRLQRAAPHLPSWHRHCAATISARRRFRLPPRRPRPAYPSTLVHVFPSLNCVRLPQGCARRLPGASRRRLGGRAMPAQRNATNCRLRATNCSAGREPASDLPIVRANTRLSSDAGFRQRTQQAVAAVAVCRRVGGRCGAQSQRRLGIAVDRRPKE